MKWIIPILAASVIFNSCKTSSGIIASPEMLRFERTIDVPGATKNELYLRVNSWFVTTFNSSESVIQFQDKEEGRVMGKYETTYMDAGWIVFLRSTIIIDVKDGRIRMQCIDPIYKYDSDMDTQFDPVIKEGGSEIAQNGWQLLSESLEAAVTTSDNEW